MRKGETKIGPRGNHANRSLDEASEGSKEGREAQDLATESRARATRAAPTKPMALNGDSCNALGFDRDAWLVGIVGGERDGAVARSQRGGAGHSVEARIGVSDGEGGHRVDRH